MISLPSTAPSPSVSDQIRIPFAQLMVPAVLQHPRVRLAGAAEPSDTLRARFAADHGCPVHADLRELLARSDVDAVYVATPHQFHREHAVLAVESGKHVVVEKPMALTLADCDAMIAAAARHGRALVVGHTHAFDAPILRVREILRSGRLGRLRMLVMFDYTDFIYRPRRPEELDTARGGGILYNQIPHQVDVARFLAGSEVRTALASTGCYDPARPTEGAMMAMLGFEDGATASLVYSGYDRFDSDEFHGWLGEGGQPKQPAHGRTRASLAQLGAGGREAAVRTDLYGYGGAIWQRLAAGATPAGHPHFGVLIASCEHGDVRHAPEGIVLYTESGCETLPLDPPKPGGGRTEVLDELCAAVLDGIAPAHDGRFARGTLATCLAIAESARGGTQVRLA
jgi:phthalate 4,5-cis-dihydrodiol dehydrogenase